MRREHGFSLVELIVAMTVTLIVSSAIYGLLTTGGNAFRREPEVADRQQNIRAAMDLITRDVFGAGAGLPSIAQVFTRNDPGGGACGGGLNGCGPMGTMGAVAAAARGGGAGDPSQNSDVLEFVTTDEQCPQLWVCSTEPGTPNTATGSAGDFVTPELLPRCLNVPGLVLASWDDGFTVAAATGLGAAMACNAGVAPPNSSLTLTAGLAPWAPFGTFGTAHPNQGSNNAVYLYRARVVRYRIAPDPDPNDAVPSLWRSESGRYTTTGVAQPEPGLGAAGPEWQLVARGIEDVQVEYLDGNGAWLNQPPVSVANDWTTLVRQVRVTLSARANAPMLQGATAALGGGAPNAVRGELRAVVTPRPAFQELQNCMPACAAALHIQ
jgi:prepilin-type N-terminal cleavage/methylation domain-containing protein